MDTLADLLKRRDELLAARGSPEQRVRFRNGETEEDVTFRTDAELSAAIYDIERRIAAATNTKIHTIRFSTCKGV